MSEYIYGTDDDEGHWLTDKEIVRCRDCVWFCAGNEQYAAVDWCKNFGCEIEPDGFCAWGERRGE